MNEDFKILMSFEMTRPQSTLIDLTHFVNQVLETFIHLEKIKCAIWARVTLPLIS
jgi:hypothetical protein